MNRCTRCGRGHSASNCPENRKDHCPQCGHKTKDECGRLVCGNRVVITAQPREMPPRIKEDE